MGTEILRPKDCLAQRIRVYRAVFPGRKNCNYDTSYSNPRSNRKQPPQQQHQHQPAVRSEKPDQRGRASSEPAISKRSGSDDSRSSRSNSDYLKKSGLVMENVTILRRGESLDSKQVRMEEIKSLVNDSIYTGSAFAVSPEPSSFPLPSFSRKRQVFIDNSATRDLRRLLRLD